MAFGIDLNAAVDHALAKLPALVDQLLPKVQPIITQALAQAQSATATLDESIDHLTGAEAAQLKAQMQTNALLRQVIIELRKR